MTTVVKVVPTSTGKIRTARVTGRKLAGAAPMLVHSIYRLEPRDRVRPIVAMLSSEENRQNLLEINRAFLTDFSDVAGLQVGHTFETLLCKQMETRGVGFVVRLWPVQRLAAYPLRRTQLITFNHESDRVTAELSEVRRLLPLRGVGADDDAAFRDLEQQFDKLIREKVRVPPHVQKPADVPLRALIDYLVDWERFRAENPLPRLLWGQVITHGYFSRLKVRWLLGPGGVRDETSAIPGLYKHPRLQDLADGEWFQGVVKEYPDRVEWVEPPSRCIDPTNGAARQAAWDAIPRIVADKPDQWPLKGG